MTRCFCCCHSWWFIAQVKCLALEKSCNTGSPTQSLSIWKKKKRKREKELWWTVLKLCVSLVCRIGFKTRRGRQRPFTDTESEKKLRQHMFLNPLFSPMHIYEQSGELMSVLMFVHMWEQGVPCNPILFRAFCLTSWARNTGLHVLASAMGVLGRWLEGSGQKKLQVGVLKYWHHLVVADAVLSLCGCVGAKRDLC